MFPIAKTLLCTHSACLYLCCQTQDSVLLNRFTNARMMIYGWYIDPLNPICPAPGLGTTKANIAKNSYQMLNTEF